MSAGFYTPNMQTMNNQRSVNVYKGVMPLNDYSLRARAQAASGTYGGGGAGGGNLSSLISEYKKKMEEANRQNIGRYNQIGWQTGGDEFGDSLGGYRGRYQRGMDYIAQQSGQGRSDIQDRWNREVAQNDQRMLDQGLSGTTIAPTMRMGYEREKSADLRRYDDAMLQQKLATDAALSGDLLSFMERRNDIAPDYNQLIALAQGMGRNSGGGIGGGMVGGGRNVNEGFVDESKRGGGEIDWRDSGSIPDIATSRLWGGGGNNGGSSSGSTSKPTPYTPLFDFQKYSGGYQSQPIDFAAIGRMPLSQTGYTPRFDFLGSNRGTLAGSQAASKYTPTFDFASNSSRGSTSSGSGTQMTAAQSYLKKLLKG